MSDNSEDTKVGRWPRKRTIVSSDNVRRIGEHKGKQSGNTLRKRELTVRTQQQLDRTLSELEMYKHAHHNLAGILEALVHMHGPQSIPIELLEKHCKYGNVVLAADEATQCVTVTLKPVPEPIPEVPPPLPEGAPQPSSLTLLREGQTLRDGKVVQQHGEYYAEVVDELPI